MRILVTLQRKLLFEVAVNLRTLFYSLKISSATTLKPNQGFGPSVLWI